MIDSTELAMQGLGSTFSPTMLVSEVMDKWPSTIQVFVQLRLACHGCPFPRFHTLEEVAAEYQMDPVVLLKKLQASVNTRQA
jgi:hybrid cluster-associated redox disulfide protein